MRVLIISPHFPPSNAADMQRVRLVLPYLREQGVEAEVLCVDSDQVATPNDTWLAAGLPQDALFHRVKALDLKWGKLPGFGTLTFRALGALRRRGDELLGRKVERGKLKAERWNRKSGDGSRRSEVSGRRSEVSGRRSEFDLVYFSTTQFGIHVLGPRWKQKFGVPFVMDYQDPWVSDYYREHPDVVPPGGRLKYAISSAISRYQEPRVLRACSGITSVSAAYPEQLMRRYGGAEIRKRKVESRNEEETASGQSPSAIKLFQLSTFNFPLWSSSLFSTVLPFPGDARDFERVKQDNIRQTVFDPNDGLQHWVYVGVCPPSMLLAVRALFAALASRKAESGKQKAEMEKLRLHFIGTSYAATGTGVKIVEPLAVEYGLSEWVHESTDRIPYSETLRCLLDADALIIPGSDDPGYTASKIYPYLLAEKPLLAVFHEQSSVVDLIRKVGGGTVISFHTGEAPEAIAARIASEWLTTGGPEHALPLDQVAFAPYTAREQAKQLAAFFRNVLGSLTLDS